jgi:asparagine synthase (glutamine-hydrolysing)
MCGIAGIVSLRPGLPPPGLDQVSRMIAALRHRGPDEFGAFRDASAALGHARLSIIDLATGQQPLCNEDGTLWITFNGEIFNYVELRDELLSLGHVFRTHSDTEVIVHAYESWGEAAFERFNGQWAVGLWDRRRRRLVLARDPVGVRPLHWCLHEGRLFFASEVKAIFAADATIPRAIDPVGLAQTFTFWSIVPPQGIFRGVSELEPGHVRTYDGERVTESRAWQPRYPLDGDGGFTGTPAEAARATRAVLDDAARLRVLRADVPVGSYLSGGLDSSLVAALGLSATGDRFQTFSLRFQDAEYDETEYQRLMAARLGSEHHEVVVSRSDIARVFPDVIRHTERPILRTAPAPLFLLSKLVRDAGIKVVLTGEGADEMFGGYDLFREGRVRRFWARQPASAWRPALLGRLYPYLARSPVAQQAMARQFFGRNLGQWQSPGFAHDTRWQTTGALARLFSPAVKDELGNRDVVAEFLSTLPPEFGRWSFLAQDQYIEVRTLLSGYLLSSQGDRMLMAHSVEGRFPFLDRHVMDFANRLPASYKLRGLDEKHVLKRASADVVPAEILRRKKQPYRAPDALSFVGPDAPPYLAEVMDDRAVADAGVFDPRVVAQLWSKCRTRGDSAQFSNADNMALVGVLSTQLLHAQFVRPGTFGAEPPVAVRIVDALAPEYRP